MKLLGFAGKKNSGKNTSSSYLFGTVMVNLGLCESMEINDQGRLVVPLIREEGETEVEKIEIDPLSPNVEAQRFYEEHVWPWCKIYSFADPLKAVCCQILGLNPAQCYGSNDDKNALTNYKWGNMPGEGPQYGIEHDQNGAEYGIDIKSGQMTAREVMQHMGTEIFRKMNPNVWVEATMRRIQKEQPQMAVVCDVRFPNEVEAIQKAGGKVIKFLRNPHSNEDQHASEKLLDDKGDDYFDAIVDNSEMSILKQNEKVKETLIQWGWGQLTES